MAVRPTVIYGLDTKKEKGGAGGAKIFIDVDQDGAVLEMSVSDGHFGETADMVLHVQRRDTGYTGQRMLEIGRSWKKRNTMDKICGCREGREMRMLGMGCFTVATSKGSSQNMKKKKAAMHRMKSYSLLMKKFNTHINMLLQLKLKVIIWLIVA